MSSRQAAPSESRRRQEVYPVMTELTALVLSNATFVLALVVLLLIVGRR